MIIYRADTKNETMMKSLKGNKILTFYVKVDTVDNKYKQTLYKVSLEIIDTCKETKKIT